MEEIWEVIKSTKKQSGITINYVISNQAHVKLEAYFNDNKIASYDLTLGNGLYVKYIHDYPTILIRGCGGDIYRHVYFMQYTGHQYKKGYQIHHLDYNHCNNSIDNLIYCSSKEHGQYHKFQFKLGNETQGYEQIWTDLEKQQLKDYNKAKEYYKWLDTNKDIFNIDNAKQYIKYIIQEIERIAIPYIENYKKEKQKEKQLEKELKQQQKIQDKLNSGNYYIDENGKLIFKYPKWTAERREKTMKTRYKTMYNNQEWRDKCRNGLLKTLREHPECTTKGQPCKYKGSIGISKDGEHKYVFENELQHYIDLGYHIGFK